MKNLFLGTALLLMSFTALGANGFPKRSVNQHRPTKLELLMPRSPVQQATLHCQPMLDANGQQMYDENGLPEYMCWDEVDLGGGGGLPCTAQHQCGSSNNCYYDNTNPWAGCYYDGGICTPCY
jgi:hypothetical protein